MIASLIKVRSGALAASLDLATLSATEKQLRRTPWLGAVRLSADGDRLRVSVTGLVATVSVSIEAAKAEGGEMAVPLQKLADLTSAFPGSAELTIAADDNAAVISSGGSRFRLAVFPISDLPTRHVLGKETGHTTLDAKTTRDLFSRVTFAISDDVSRYYLNGVHLHGAEGKLVATATDGFRLAVARAPTSSTLSADRSLIVPASMLKPIQRLLGKASGDVTLRRSAKLFSIEGAGFQIVTTLIDATYPDCERVVPHNHPNAATCSRAGLTESLERFAAVADPHDTAQAVTMRWNGDGGLHLGAPDGSADDLAASTEGQGEVSAQVRHIAELLEAMDGDNVAITASRPTDPIVFTDPDDASFFAVQCTIQPRSG